MDTILENIVNKITSLFGSKFLLVQRAALVDFFYSRVDTIFVTGWESGLTFTSGIAVGDWKDALMAMIGS